MTSSHDGTAHHHIRDAWCELEEHARLHIDGPEAVGDVAERLAARMASLIVLLDEQTWNAEAGRSITELDVLVPQTVRAQTAEQLRQTVDTFRDRVRHFLAPI